MKPFQFSLRTLMLVVTMIALAMGTVIVLWPGQNTITGLPGFDKCMRKQTLEREIEIARMLTLLAHGTPTTPEAKESNPELFYTVQFDKLVQVDAMGPTITDNDLDLLILLPHLQTLTIGEPHISDAGLDRVKSLSNLVNLHLCDMTLTEKTFSIINELQQLEVLTLDNCQWPETTGSEIKCAKSNSNLKIVEINQRDDRHK